MQSKNTEMENLMNECEEKDRETIRLKEQLDSLEDKQMLIEKKNVET